LLLGLGEGGADIGDIAGEAGLVAGQFSAAPCLEEFNEEGRTGRVQLYNVALVRRTAGQDGSARLPQREEDPCVTGGEREDLASWDPVQAPTQRFWRKQFGALLLGELVHCS
jgi:hypothetical protein